MRNFAKAEGIAFGLFTFPAGVAYENGIYKLSDLHLILNTSLSNLDIPLVDGVPYFKSDPDHYFDNTDHLTYKGNRRISDALSQFFLHKMSKIAQKAECSI